MAKSTGDIIEKLLKYRDVGGLPVVALVVLGKDGSKLMFAGESEAQPLLDELNQFVTNDGNPMGFIGVTANGKVKVYPLDNYKDSPRVEAYLEEVRRASLTTLIAMSNIADMRVC